MKKNHRGRVNGKNKAIIALAVVLVLTIACGIIGVTGLKLGNGNRLKPWMPTTDAEQWPEALRLGLDLRGGVYVEYSAKMPDNTDASLDELMEGTMAVIQNRLTNVGYADSTVQRLGSNGIRVEIPTANTGDRNEVDARNAVLDLIGNTAKLEFVAPTGELILDGTMVERAVAQYNQEASNAGDRYFISFKLNGEGTSRFAAATTQWVGYPIYIFLDGELLMGPTVNTPILDGVGQITGNYTLEQANNYAVQIQSGALPMELTQQKVDTVSATLGPNALTTSVKAAIIGILLVMGVMIFRYRLNGVIASWALVIYIIVLFLLIAIIPSIQLTLPGLAGIVLGIGMAVDANVIIFERFNEEVRAGRGLKQAVRAGFKNALSAIVDANVTTLIASIVLLVYGTGSIQGFAKTLLLGVLTSLFTAVIVTRFLMKRIVEAGVRNTNLFCAVKATKEVQ